MADTIKEQIVKRIAATAAAIAGIKSVQRMSKWGEGISYADVPTIVLTQGDDVLEQGQVAPYTRRRAELIASVVVRTEDGDERKGDEVLNAFGGMLEAALMADRSVGGLAEEVKPPEYLEAVAEEVNHVAIAMRFQVIFRHLRGDPTRSE